MTTGKRMRKRKGKGTGEGKGMVMRPSRQRLARPWVDYGLRLLACGLMFVTGYGLLVTSTFALRMRDDANPGAIALALALVLSLAPLLFGRRFLGALLASSFLLSGIGAYWWTRLPWDELFTKSGFPAREAPTIADYALVAAPAAICAFYVAVSRASRVHADLKSRGVDREEIAPAAAHSFLAGAAALVASALLAGALWLALANGWLLVRHPLVGVPAIATAGALVALAWVISGLRFGGEAEAPAWTLRRWVARAKA